MAMYSIKIGEIHLQSDAPITEEQRIRAVNCMSVDGYFICASPDGLDIMGTVNVETVRLRQR
jgi:hypothetical protein